MKVVFSELALAELDQILSYVGARSPLGAQRIEARIRKVVDRIGRFPESAAAVAGRPGVRRAPLVRYPYVIYYEVADETVIILRILHGARRRPW